MGQKHLQTKAITLLSKQKPHHKSRTANMKQGHPSSTNSRRIEGSSFCNRWAHLQRVGSYRPNAQMRVMMLSLKQTAGAQSRSWLSSGARKWLKTSAHTPLLSPIHPPLPHLHCIMGNVFNVIQTTAAHDCSSLKQVSAENDPFVPNTDSTSAVYNIYLDQMKLYQDSWRHHIRTFKRLFPSAAGCFIRCESSPVLSSAVWMKTVKRWHKAAWMTISCGTGGPSQQV